MVSARSRIRDRTSLARSLRVRRAETIDRTTHAVVNQVRAMGFEVFEVGLFKPTATGKEPVMLPRTWDIDTLLRSVPWLRHQNRDGRNIYIRPKGEHNLSLVDDLSADRVQAMKAAGLAPALVVQTSLGNFQAWVKHPETLSKEVSTVAARMLAEKFDGDRGAADWRHFGRLAGFTNRKDKYRSESGLYPFVLLTEHNGLPYPVGDKFTGELRKRIEVEQAEKQARLSRPPITSPEPRRLKSIESFRCDSRYGGDGTRIDFAYAIYAFSHGLDDATVDAAIRSRDLSHKGPDRRQDEYVERTIQKALGSIRGECRSR